MSAIQLGPPFWNETVEAPNILLLDNDGSDPLPAGMLDVQLGALFSGLGRYVWMRLSGRPVRFVDVVEVPGHSYSWPRVCPDIIPFLRDRLVTDGASR